MNSVPLVRKGLDILHKLLRRLLLLLLRIGYATTLSQAVVDRPSVRIVLTGSTGERALLREIARGTSARTTLLTDMTIGQLAALLRRAQLVLGVDSRPLHLATAQGTPRSRGTTSWMGCPAKKRVQAQKRAG